MQRQAAEQEREQVKRARAESGTGFFTESEAGRQDPLVQLGGQQSQTQVMMEEEERLQELRERETAVRQLEVSDAAGGFTRKRWLRPDEVDGR